MMKIPGFDQIEAIGKQVGEFMGFGHKALLTIIANQHAIHTRLAALETAHGMPAEPGLKGLDHERIDGIARTGDGEGN